MAKCQCELCQQAPKLTEQERIQSHAALDTVMNRGQGSTAASNDPERVRAYLNSIS